SPERVLVLSSDTNTLTACDVSDGNIAWRHNLGEAPCLGRPVIGVRELEKRVYVPTYDGKVHVIEVVDGQLLGWYDLGRALTVGDVLQEVQIVADENMLVYLPADERYIYVLDMADSARVPPRVTV